MNQSMIAAVGPLLVNCFLLFIPVFIWNAVFHKKLPAAYQKPAWDSVPRWVCIAENVLRVPVFALPLILKLDPTGDAGRAGFALYLAGLGAYALSWGGPMIAPQSAWSRSAIGFTAPAWTTAVWLAGIGLVGRETTVGIVCFFPVYPAVCLLFVAAHTLHAALVFRNART
jgi:hypothetical protein